MSYCSRRPGCTESHPEVGGDFARHADARAAGDRPSADTNPGERVGRGQCCNHRGGGRERPGAMGTPCCRQHRANREPRWRSRSPGCSRPRRRLRCRLAQRRRGAVRHAACRRRPAPTRFLGHSRVLGFMGWSMAGLTSITTAAEPRAVGWRSDSRFDRGRQRGGCTGFRHRRSPPSTGATRLLRRYGPNDGVVLIADTVWPGGANLVALGSDHFLTEPAGGRSRARLVAGGGPRRAAP